MPKTLLLADDSVTIQKVVGISFANEDIRLVTVDNGDDALARAREITPDIVLADVVMPGMNGYEVCEAIKSDPALRHVPVLLLTGTFEAYDEERARRAGADGHVTKPFEAQALVDLVNARLAQAAAPAAAAPAAAEPEPAPASADGELDFFDEVTAPSGVEAAPAAPGATEDAAARTTALIEGEGEGEDTEFGVAAERAEAFAFEAPDDVHDELSVTQPPASAPSPAETTHDATVALFDDEDAFANAETLPPVDAEPGEPDPFAATRVVDEPAEADSEEPLGDDWFQPEEPVTAPPAVGEPFAAVGPREESLEDGLADPAAARDYDVSSSDLGDPLAEAPAPPTPDAGAPDAQAPAFEAFGTAAGEPPAEAPAAFDAPPADAVAELPPAFRHQIQDTLEKVAWEAFGDLADKLVKETLERVEKIAWEVIPQMAETLIQEEIRRLKDEDAG